MAIDVLQMTTAVVGSIAVSYVLHSRLHLRAPFNILVSWLIVTIGTHLFVLRLDHVGPAYSIAIGMYGVIVAVIVLLTVSILDSKKPGPTP